MTQKSCARCGESKPLEEFHKRATAKYGRGSYCYPCAREQSSEASRRIKADPDRRLAREEYLRVYRRRTHLARFYGMTEQEYDAMLLQQGGCCAVCSRVPADRLAVDHDHITGAIRGLLCTQCNTLLGMANDDVDRLMAAAAYLLASRNVLEMTR